MLRHLLAARRGSLINYLLTTRRGNYKCKLAQSTIYADHYFHHGDFAITANRRRANAAAARAVKKCAKVEGRGEDESSSDESDVVADLKRRMPFRGKEAETLRVEPLSCNSPRYNERVLEQFGGHFGKLFTTREFARGFAEKPSRTSCFDKTRRAFFFSFLSRLCKLYIR